MQPDEEHGVVENWSRWARGHADPIRCPVHWYLVAAFRSARRSNACWECSIEIENSPEAEP